MPKSASKQELLTANAEALVSIWLRVDCEFPTGEQVQVN